MRHLFLLEHVFRQKEEPYRCVIKLGVSGSITGFDVDTSHFNGASDALKRAANFTERNVGNEAPEVSVEALFAADGEVDPLSDDKRVRSLTWMKRCTSLTCISVEGDTPKGSLGSELQTSLLNHCLIDSQLCEIEHVPRRRYCTCEAPLVRTPISLTI